MKVFRMARTLSCVAVCLTSVLLPHSAWAGLKGVGTNPGSFLPAAVNNLNVSWWYDWASAKNGASGNGEYIPMIWGAGNVNTTEASTTPATVEPARF